MILTGRDIIEKGIVSNLIDSDVQEQISGVDLTIGNIEAFVSFGTIDFDNRLRVRPIMEDCNWELLMPGCYLVTFNEVIEVPRNYMGIARPRSSLLRMGATLNTAFWDAGYKGKSQALLVIHNPKGIRLMKNARVAQIAFMKIGKKVDKEYEGVYQGENL